MGEPKHLYTVMCHWGLCSWPLGFYFFTDMAVKLSSSLVFLLPYEVSMCSSFAQGENVYFEEVWFPSQYLSYVSCVSAECIDWF